jgi:hypothetical protein
MLEKAWESLPPITRKLFEIQIGHFVDMEVKRARKQ